MAWKARRKPGQGAGKIRIEKVLLELKVGQGLMVFWGGMYGGTISWHYNAEPTQAAGPPEVRWAGSPGRITAVCTLIGKLCSAGVQSGTLTGRLPSTAAL